jgi:uncharacterized protein (DUF305 family)
VLVALVALALGAAGCGGGGGSSSQDQAQAPPETNIVQAGAPGEPSRQLSPEEAAKVNAIQPTEADVEFMQGMIHHHAQAIQMADWVPDRTASTSLRLLARRMAVTQEGEIELIERWLAAQGLAPQSHGGHQLMPGMLTQKQLDRLKANKGRAFDRLWLRYMTLHHEGALTMVRDLRTEGGGMQSEIDHFARNVEADQAIEIKRMQELLEKV